MVGYICSAVLVNNTSQDLKPYVLTAYHCAEEGGNLGQHNYFTFYFDHESSSCSGSSGYYGHSETGSYVRSWGNMNTSDFALLEMDDDPASSWDPYFAGWRRNTSSPTIGAGIHHPGGDAKKINFDDSLIYSEISKKNEDRKIPIKQMLRDEALKAFEIWNKKTDKIEY